MISTILSIVSLIMMIAFIPIMVLTFRGRLQFLQGVLLSSGAMVLSFVASVSGLNMQIGQNIINIAINETFEQIKQTFETVPTEQLQKMLGNITVDQATAFRGEIANTLVYISDMYTLLFPAIMILSILAFCFVAFMLIKLILGLFKFDVSNFPMFSEFKISKTTIIALFVSLFGASAFPLPTINAAFLNIAVVIIGAMTVCGFSLFDFQVRKKVDNSWARVLIYVAITVLGFSLSSILMYSLVFAAIIDSFFDFRKLSPKEEKDGQ